MKPVRQMKVYQGISVGELLKEMNDCGVLGAGRIGKATNLITEMFSDPDCTVFLTIAGALVPGGLRKVIRDLIEKGYINVIVSTGANIVHDIIEALGYSHLMGTFQAEDKILKAENIGRIGDIYVNQEVFKHLENWIHQMLREIPEEKRVKTSVSELLKEMGKRIRDPESILAAAVKKDVPIISPAFLDSIAGFHLWMFNQNQKIVINPFIDVDELMERVLEAKRVGVIILGGGHPKHFALFANTFREGVDYAVQITMDRPEPGGLSGAPLEEAISWSKIQPEGKMVNVICDVTIAFPLIIAGVLENLEKL